MRTRVTIELECDQKNITENTIAITNLLCRVADIAYKQIKFTEGEEEALSVAYDPGSPLVKVKVKVDSPVVLPADQKVPQQ